MIEVVKQVIREAPRLTDYEKEFIRTHLYAGSCAGLVFMVYDGSEKDRWTARSIEKKTKRRCNVIIR